MGRWEMTFRRSVEFDRVGNVVGDITGRYRVHNGTLTVVSRDGRIQRPTDYAYKIKKDSLTLVSGESSPDYLNLYPVYRRVPDDS